VRISVRGGNPVKRRINIEGARAEVHRTPALASACGRSRQSSGEGASTPHAPDSQQIVLIVVVLIAVTESLVPRVVVIVLRRGPLTPGFQARCPFRWRSLGPD
jgi:hypothetical protein